MAEHGRIYKCKICGKIIEVLHESAGTLVCCNQAMKLLEETSTDAATEKHVPIIEGNKVKVGSVEHPMEEEHYIEWIEATDGKNISRVFLKPGDKPEAEFSFDVAKARAYCNLHELWKNE